MPITIQPLREQDAEDLYQFEYENRAFFEKMVPGRGDDYFQHDQFQRSLKQLLLEQAEGTSYFTLIRDAQGTILGRMNLIDIEKAKGSGHIGYRVSAAAAGKGIASQALRLLMGEAVERFGLTELFAKTTRSNIPSQKVLLKNDFLLESIEPEAFERDGKKEDFLHYRWSR